MLKNLVLVLALVAAPIFGHAANLNVYGGLNSTEFDGDGSWDRDFGIDVGVLYMHQLQGDLYLRTGAGLAQRNSEFDAGFISDDVKFLLLEIPVTAYYQLNDQWAMFGGLSLNLVLDDDDVSGSKSLVVNLPFGFRVNVSGPHSIEGFAEIGITDLASNSVADFKVGNTIGAKYIYAFSLN